MIEAEVCNLQCGHKLEDLGRTMVQMKTRSNWLKKVLLALGGQLILFYLGLLN